MIVTILHILVSLGLIGVILLQVQGRGLSTAFGGGGGEFYRSKRSIEKVLVWVTVALSLLFSVLSVLLLFPHK